MNDAIKRAKKHGWILHRKGYCQGVLTVWMFHGNCVIAIDVTGKVSA